MQVAKNKKVLKFVLLGDGGVGKSCLMNVYVKEEFNPTPAHTIGVEFLKKEIQTPYSPEPVILQIWDTAGQERFKSLRTPFYRGSDACLLTFAVDDEDSFRHLKYWRDEFLLHSNITDKNSFPFIVIGNKIDVPDNNRKVMLEQAETWCKEYNMPYFETSAKDVINVDTAFATAATKALELEATNRLVPWQMTDTISLKTRTHRSHSGCC